MKKLFIETPESTEWVKEYLPDEQLSGLQQELMNDLDSGLSCPVAVV